MNERLVGRWLHSHEESSGSRIVFHPPSYPFPPARGRRGITLEKGGAAQAEFPGPTDKTQKAAGSWSISGNKIRLNAAPWNGEYEIESADPNSLVLHQLS
jgi:hypothetical protein